MLIFTRAQFPCVYATYMRNSARSNARAVIDRNGNQDILRFPPFHADILEQRHWDASDYYGRIKIVLAEGLSRPNRSPPFERVKDVVALSFQHAPLSKLGKMGYRALLMCCRYT